MAWGCKWSGEQKYLRHQVLPLEDILAWLREMKSILPASVEQPINMASAISSAFGIEPNS